MYVREGDGSVCHVDDDDDDDDASTVRPIVPTPAGMGQVSSVLDVTVHSHDVVLDGATAPSCVSASRYVHDVENDDPNTVTVASPPPGPTIGAIPDTVAVDADEHGGRDVDASCARRVTSSAFAVASAVAASEALA